MKAILKPFLEHGTYIQPDAFDYILSKNDPEDFTSFIIKNLREYPLVLTINQIKDIEQLKKNKPIPKTSLNSIEEKERQKKVISSIYGDESRNSMIIEENENEEDDIEDDHRIDISEVEPEEEIAKPQRIDIKKVKGWKPKSIEYTSEIKIVKDVTGKSTCEGTTNDFNKLFIDRYNVLRRILQNQRREIANVIPIKKIKKGGFRDIQIVGIVKEVRTTVNGHRLIEIEDETDVATCIALKNNREVIQIANEVIDDEIVGIRGQLSRNGDLIIIRNIIFPDISIQKDKNKAEIPVCAAFLSDIHMGSKMFMEKQWQSFLRWINGEMGNSRQKDVAGRIKYLVIPGDVVDGIGIYPNQEKELSIVDIYHQYEALAEQFQLIPDHISIIMQPGNHDAVRPAEPQPTFEKEIQDLFSEKDIYFVGNPCYFSLHGVEILSYHGQSLLDFATNVQHLNYHEPVETMKVMLRKHHLAPTYGGYTPLAPEHSDYMIINKVPDVFVTGHVHKAMIDNYRGVTLINASSWQSQTSYQKRLNFIPDSAKLPIVDLKTNNVTMMDFSRKLS